MSKEVDSMLEEIGNVLRATETNLDSLNSGERIQIKDLAAAVGLATAKEPKHVMPFVNHFVHNTTLAYVTRGKNGGIIKGSKPAKVIKAGKKTDPTETV
jgi:hypothetical protein